MENEEKIIIICSIIIAILAASLIAFSSYFGITGNTIGRHSYTKAICEGNACRDYEISCQNTQILYKQPITEEVYFSEDWEDPRSEKEKEKLCG